MAFPVVSSQKTMGVWLLQPSSSGCPCKHEWRETSCSTTAVWERILTEKWTYSGLYLWVIYCLAIWKTECYLSWYVWAFISLISMKGQRVFPAHQGMTLQQRDIILPIHNLQLLWYKPSSLACSCRLPEPSNDQLRWLIISSSCCETLPGIPSALPSLCWGLAQAAPLGLQKTARLLFFCVFDKWVRQTPKAC